MTPCVAVRKRRASGNSNRLFFIIPKSAVLKASARNRIKRRARAVLTPFLLKKSGYGYTVVIRRGAENLAFEDFKAQILRCINQ